MTDASPALFKIPPLRRQIKTSPRSASQMMVIWLQPALLARCALLTCENGATVSVKAELADRFPGLIHDQSPPVSTLFVEPYGCHQTDTMLPAAWNWN